MIKKNDRMPQKNTVKSPVFPGVKCQFY